MIKKFKKKFKRTVSVLVSVLMIAGLFAVVPMSASAEPAFTAMVGDKTYSTLQAAINAASNGDTVTLYKDVTENVKNTISGKSITIQSDGTGDSRKTVNKSKFYLENGAKVTFKNIILDASGLSCTFALDYFICVRGTESVLNFDTGAQVQNFITAGASAAINAGYENRNGGGGTINIKDGSKFTGMTGIYGVIRLDGSATLNMSGGTIENCTSTGSSSWLEGVVLYISNNSTFNMTGGTIQHNAPSGSRAGSVPGVIYMHPADGNNTAKLLGGTITGNSAQYGGAIYNASTGTNNTLIIGGNVVLNGNTGTGIDNTGTASSNIYLNTNQYFTFEENNHLTEGANVGVYTAAQPSDSADVKIATGALKTDAAYIHSDLTNNAGVVYCDGEKDWLWNGAEYVELGAHHTHEANTLWLSVKAKGTIPEAATISSDLADVTLAYGYAANSASLSVTATPPTGATLSYQWYSNNLSSNTGGTAIEGATEATYTIPTGKSAGIYYYYCDITSSIEGNYYKTSKTSSVATVTVTTPPLTAEYAQVGEDYDPQFVGDTYASLWQVTVTPGDEAIESVGIKVTAKESGKAGTVTGAIPVISGDVVFGVVVGGRRAEIGTIAAIVNGVEVSPLTVEVE